MIQNRLLAASVTKLDMKLHSKVVHLFDDMYYYLSTSDRNCVVTCHSITRAVAQHIKGLRVVSGKHVAFVPEDKDVVSVIYTIHSWLVTPDDAIIECYPVDALAPLPLLIPTRGDNTIITGGARYRPVHDTDMFLRMHINTFRMKQSTEALSAIITDAQAHR